MTETATAPAAASAASRHRSDVAMARLRRRYAAERRFKAYGVTAIAIALGMLLLLLGSIVSTGIGAFVTRQLSIEVYVDPAAIDPSGKGDPAGFDRNAMQDLIQDALYGLFPDVEGRSARRDLRGLVSPVAGAAVIGQVLNDPSLLGQTVTFRVPLADALNQLAKGAYDRTLDESLLPVSAQQIEWYDRLEAEGRISRTFNWTFFTGSDSNYPELAGIWGAALGSLYTMAVTLLLALPIGVATAVYLEEFAPRNWFTNLVEVNINNLAAVPSIIFGLLGLAVFLQFFGLPRSAPLVGGMVLALMSLPTIIIAARAALKAVPPSIREAALGMGASRQQTVFHHVLPLAMPGIMTGTIIAMAHALGETAPLLMIGMNAFITQPPTGVTSPSALLPVQVYIWADRPERGFVELTSAAIMALLVFLIFMNAAAVWLRRRFERRW